MFQMHDRNFTRRFPKFSTVLKSFVLATFAEKAGRAMEGLSLFSLCLSAMQGVIMDPRRSNERGSRGRRGW